ncbi:MAG TPA: ABC transporter ATP-binding protein [Mycobacteriales bacterium]|nr:ABC transporter ATP-binding protein [Mycobacteriales bacterium]
MAFGPVGGGGGFGGGGRMGGGDNVPGLQFGGIPEELAATAEKLTASEPDWSGVHVPFHHPMPSTKRFSLRQLLGAHKPALALSLLLVVAEAAAKQAGPLLTKVGIDRGIARGSMHTLLVIVVIYLITVVLAAVISGLRVSWTGIVGQRLLNDLRVRVFAHLQRLSLDYFTDEKAGRIMTRMTSDIESLNQLLQDGLVNLLVQGLTMIFVTVVLLTLDVKLGLITIFFVFPTMGALTFWYRNRSDTGYDEVRSEIANVLADLSENLAGIRVVTATGRERRNIWQHRSIVKRYRDANLYTAQLNAVYGPGSQLIGGVGQALIVLIGGYFVLHHQLSIGTLTAFVLYLGNFFAPIQQLVQLYGTYQQGQAAVRKLSDLFATVPSVQEAPDATDLPPIRGEIELRGVDFAYSPGVPVLEDISLLIPAGETIALVGPTGAGKSTIAKLVTRFYDPTAGEVLIDGRDLRGVTLESLRRQLGVVPQEPFLFAGSLRDNLAFAKPEASDDEVLAAIDAVGLDDLVSRLPDGLDTYIHERGTSLSAGERQLVALGRAFLAQPRVVVLDEATSNLDLRSERRIEVALDRLVQGRTAVLIAHRLSTAMRADRVAVIDEGRLIELGTHDELVRSEGRYRDMFRTWESSWSSAAS